MNIPSTKTLDRAFPGKGKALRRLLESAAAVREHPAALELVRTCYHPPGLSYQRMTALNHEAGTFGIECIWHAGEGPDSCTGTPAFEYLNTGDMYAATIVRASNGRYRVADIGSIIERGNCA